MNLCYRSISYQNSLFSLYLPKLKKNCKFRGSTDQVSPSINLLAFSGAELKYRGVAYTKTTFEPALNSLL